jgi:Leu/Phe-tRNA-protein transferase
MSTTQRQISYITLEDVKNQETLEQYIYPNMRVNYYWSDDFFPQMYIALAQAGFISVTHIHEDRLLLLPEIQTHYAVLDYENLRIGKRVAKMLLSARFRLAFNTRFDAVLSFIQNAYEDCWMKGEYAELMHTFSQNSYENFELFSTELYDEDNGELIAGEIGYITHNIYTSLSGFHNPSKAYSNWGTLQLVLLAHHLKEQGVRFWNLGHASMEYKIDLGAKILSRADFLAKWRNTNG